VFFEFCFRFGENRSLSERSSIAYLRSSALGPITSLSTRLHSTVPHLCASTQQTDARAHYAFMLNCTIVTIKHANRRLTSCTLTLNHTLPTLKPISTVSSNKPKAAKCKVFDFFGLFYFLFFIFCLFVLFL
jgi:hypothetical protein